ncbi:MAG: hypothetical protein Kow00121_01970 [Elainellaceae cyanobacterium]
MRRTFRRYHRIIAPVVALPLLLTVITGMLVTVVRDWQFLNLGITSSVLLRVHTGEIFHLEAIYPILNGLGLIGLIITGLTMSGIFNKRKRQVTAK